MWHVNRAISLETEHDLGEGRRGRVWDLPNCTHLLASDDLKSIGNKVWEGFRKDKLSRAKWEKRTAAAMDMAMQVQKGKSFPWPGCANVVFPLVSIACLQFHSRAYPALINGVDIVKYRVVGEDPGGGQSKRAQRIGMHMSYQVLEEDQSWEEQHDRLFLNVPIVGCAFIKSYFSAAERANTSEMVVAQDLILDYYAKSVEKAARKSQLIPVTRNEIYSSVVEGRFRDVLDEAWYAGPAQPLQIEPGTAKADNRKGQMPPLSPDEDTPFTSIEQHCRLDLDGDGYAEPWIVTIEASSHCVIRLVAGWDSEKQIERSIYGRLSRIHSTEYYTKYGFIPSPDGGVYDLGFGVLLGPLNATVNSVVNQLLDAGTLATTSGGFLARGAKIRGGQYQFTQFGWNRVDATGDDLKKSIFPMPVRDPSPVLLQLLQFIVQYVQRLSGSTDALTGENPGQNTPAQTQQSMIEQGMKIYSALFKRMWRSMKEEFKKLYILNATYLPDNSTFGPAGQSILREDYLADPKNIAPVADPNVTSDTQVLQRAQAIAQRAMSVPGYDIQMVERNFLRAMKCDNADALYPGADKVPPLPNPRAMLEQVKAQGRLQEVQAKSEADMKKFVMEMQETERLNTAKISQLEAQAAKLLQDADGVQTGHEIAAFNAAIGALKAHNEGMRDRMTAMLKSLEMKHDHEQDDQAAQRERVAGLGSAPGNAGTESAAGAMAGGA